MSLVPMDCIKSQPVFQWDTNKLTIVDRGRGRVSVPDRRGGRVSVPDRWGGVG